MKSYVICMRTFYNARMANNDICRVIYLLWYVSIMILPQIVKKKCFRCLLNSSFELFDPDRI